MRRTKAIEHVCGGVFGALLVAGAAAVIVTACTHDDTTVFVHGVLAQPLIAPGQSCTYTSDPTQATISYGRLDVELDDTEDYSAEFLVGNQLVPQGNPSAPATETSYVNIQGAVVRITDIDGNQIRTYTQLLGATIPPSTGTTPGYAPMPVTIVDQMVTGMYGGSLGMGNIVRVITYTRFFGKTLGGQSVESNEFEFPVDLCAGCLISFPLGVTDPNLMPQPNCGFGASSTSTTTSQPCIIGQDDVIPCTVCAGNPFCLSIGLTDAGTGGSPTD
ncbi:MAG TPA: hypothetical protein VK841_13385 [Polyangiaceae bacterium]|jgi:hypothetical protein|nr:hypothetical protein [Polyangiaceae bacterium]